MRISLEFYLMTNLFMNTIAIALVARSRGRVHWGPVIFAAAFGAIYAVGMQLEIFHLLRAWPARLLLAVALSAVALRVNGLVDLLGAVASLIGGTIFLGGVQYLLRRLMGGASPELALIGAVLGATGLATALNVRTQRMEKWEIGLQLICGQKAVKLRALVDTGNRLHEPISGLPVLIVAEERLKPLLPEGFDARTAPDRLPRGFRMVSYGALGGEGRLACFQPDEVRISHGNGWLRAPDIWTAVYPGRLPGRVQALAPAVIGRVQEIKQNDEGGFRRWSIQRNRESNRPYWD